MTAVLGLLACLAPFFGVAAWYRDSRQRRSIGDYEGALDDARGHLRRHDSHRASLAVQAGSLRRQIGVVEAALAAMTRRADDLETDLGATQVIAANHLRTVWRLERALAEAVAVRVVAEAEAVVHAVEVDR